MKKILSITAIAFLLISLCIPCFADTYEQNNSVIDNADIISAGTEEVLASRLKEIGTKYKTDLVVLTVDDTEGKSHMEYADDYYDYNGYGYGDEKTGTLLLICMEEGNRGVWISTCGEDIERINDYEIDSILDDFVPYLSDGDYDTGVLAYADSLEFELEYEAEYGHDGEDYYTDSYAAYSGNTSANKIEKVVKAYFFAIIIGLAVGGVTAFVLKKQMTPVQQAVSARNYLVNNSFRLTKNFDIFLYSNVTKTAKPKDTDSGSGHSGGGSSHTGSSGVSHGGGGRSF